MNVKLSRYSWRRTVKLVCGHAGNRWPAQAPVAGKEQGKARRICGYRVIYFCFDETLPLYLLAIYPKNQRIDLTSEQKKRLTALAKQLKEAARTFRKAGLRSAAR